MLIFYDTCALLNHFNEIFDENEVFYVSSLTINELENIKTSGSKDEETKYNARCLLHKLKENKDKCVIIPFRNRFLSAIDEFDLPNTTDSKIIATAFDFYKNPGMEYPSDKKLFCTDDLACETIARSVGLPIFTFNEGNEEEYTGYKEVEMDNDTLADFYNHEQQKPLNRYNLVINQYLIIKQNDRVIDKYKWTGSSYEQVQFTQLNTEMFGKIVAMDGDIYQTLALDTLKSNQISMLRGAAGTGKSYLAMGYLFSLLEKGKIDRIIIFCNTVAAKGAARMGFYPGSKDEKLLDSQIGNFLKGKIPDRVYLEKMLDDGVISLIPMADIRGYDTTGMNAGVYITEAQNMDIELMRLALQRIGEDSICILDGDSNAQVDLSDYAGKKNGMRRVSEVFRGADFYGEVTLQTIKRSKIAALAQKM